MKSLLASLMLFLSFSGWAQSDQRTSSIREQLGGLWTVNIEMDSVELKNYDEGIPYLQFLEGDRFALTSENWLTLSSFTIAYSESDTLLITPNFTGKIKSNLDNKNWLVNEIELNEEYNVPAPYLIKIGPSKPLPFSLANAYILETGRGWTIYPPLSTTPNPSLELHRDMRFRWDILGTGTWKLDSIQAKLYFQIETNQVAFEIIDIDRNGFAIRPMGARNTEMIRSFVSLESVLKNSANSVTEDSIWIADSLAAVNVVAKANYISELESDPASFWKNFSGTWELTPTTQLSSQPYVLVWNENGTFMLRSGKKEKKYRWEAQKVEQNQVQLKLTRSGKEELSLLEFFVEENLHKITLSDPFTGKLESFLIHKLE